MLGIDDIPDGQTLTVAETLQLKAWWEIEKFNHEIARFAPAIGSAHYKITIRRVEATNVSNEGLLLPSKCGPGKTFFIPLHMHIN